MDEYMLYEKIKALNIEFSKDAPNINLILDETKKLLIKFPNNIKLMEIRLYALDYKGDRKNAIKLCYEILALDNTNAIAKDILLYGTDVNMAKFDKEAAIEDFTFKLFTNKQFLLLLCVLLLGWFIYLHPSKENMYCDSNLKCTISRTYIDFINVKSEILLNKRSYLYTKDQVKKCYRRTSDRCTHVVKILLSNKNGELESPFIYYYLAYNNDITDKSTEMLQGEISNFYDYLKKPEKGFYMETDYGNLLFTLIFWGTIFVFIAYYVFNFIENTIKRTFNKKQ